MSELFSTVSTWLQRLKGRRDDVSAQKLWDDVSPRIQSLARRLIQRFGSDAAFDEEDVTVSVFASLYDGLNHQQFPDLNTSEELWKVMTLMTLRKINDRKKQRNAKKRDGAVAGMGGGASNLDLFVDCRPEPSIEVMVAEQCRVMLNQLDDPTLEKIVLLKLDGFTNEEIADQLQYSRRTIQRMLNLVKDAWRHYVVH